MERIMTEWKQQTIVNRLRGLYLECGTQNLSSPVSSTIKTDHHDITGILLKVALNTITLTHIGFYNV
jgi:hypothetical protein